MSATTVIKYADQDIPEDTLKEILLNSTAVSICMALANKEKGDNVGIIRKVLAEMPDQLAGLKQTLAKVKPKQVTLYFDFPPEDFKKEDLQPTAILFSDKDLPTVVAFVQDVEDQGAAVDQLKELILEQFDLAKSQLPAMVKRLKESKTVRSAMKDILGENGICTLHFATGETAQFSMAEGALQEEEWGTLTVSSAEETPAGAEDDPAKEEEAGDELDELEKLMSGEGEEKEEKLPPGQYRVPDKKQPENKASAHPPGGTPDPTYDKIKPPPNMREADLMKWILKRVDKVPPNAYADYKQHKFFLLVPKTTVLKDLKDLKNTTAVQAPDEKKEVIPEKRIAPLPLPDIKKETASHLQTTFFKDRTVSIVDINSDDIHDPKFLADTAALKQDFAKSIGLPNIAATYGWTPGDRKELLKAAAVKQDVLDVAVNWITWLTADLIKAQQELQKRKGENAELDTAAKRAAERLAKKEQAKANARAA